MTKIWPFVLIFLTGCASYERFKQITEDLELPSRVFEADYNETWIAVRDVFKRFEISSTNPESGKIKTRWMDNTLQVNFTDSFGSSDAVKAAQVKYWVNVAEGYSYGKKVTKVTIFKRQQIENDFLQGWKEVPTDGIEEKTLLYRISRVIEINQKLRAISDAKEQEEIDSF